MARARAEGPVTLSVLDRLLDDDPWRSEEVPLSRAESIREMRAAVRRDLEWLLNTRQPVEVAAEGSMLEKSLYMYGLPDITSMGVLSPDDRKRLIHAIEFAITNFEPRITNPRVVLLTAEKTNVPALRFVIEGMLRVDPGTEHVRFDMVLDLSSKQYSVEGSNSAR